VTEAVALQVDRQGIAARDLCEVRGAVEIAVLDRVVAGLDAEAEVTLRRALAQERAASPEEFPVVGHDLHNVLAAVAGNPVLELLTQVLIRITRLRTAGPMAGLPDPLPTGGVIAVHRHIVEAIVAGDRELARHRMRRHLDALADWLR
jgi:DNA-binding FadR family transcriptional regulator